MPKFKIGDKVTNTDHWELVPPVVGIVIDVYDEYFSVSVDGGNPTFETYQEWRKLTRLEIALK